MKGIFHEELGTIARFGRRICRSDRRHLAPFERSDGTIEWHQRPTAPAGIVLVKAKDLPKHACKGQNDCKGQGGGKHPGKNSCKGKGELCNGWIQAPKGSLTSFRVWGLETSPASSSI